MRASQVIYDRAGASIADVDISEFNFDKILDGASWFHTTGITPAKLIEIRRGFIKTWFETYAKQFPFRLFEYQQQLISLRMFDAYNQWIFGAGVTPADYQAWIKDNKEAYDTFNNFQRGRVFKLPKAQYYQNR